MGLFEDLLINLPDGKVSSVLVGLHWTAVVIEINGQRYCGLASTQVGIHIHGGEPSVIGAGDLTSRSPQMLTSLVLSNNNPTQISIGLAAINALLSSTIPGNLENKDAAEVIIEKGAGKRVALVGHFPFIPKLKQNVGHLDVLELNPQVGELPAESAAEVVPLAEIVAMTSMCLLNGTFNYLLNYCRPDAFILILGPSTPLSPVFFDYGINLLAGSVVVEIDPVMRIVAEGGDFPQIRRGGVRLVSMVKP